MATIYFTTNADSGSGSLRQALANAAPGDELSKRQETKKLIAALKKTNPDVENHIFRSVENVNLNTIIAYKDKDGVHSFLDTYDDAKIGD